MLGERPATRHFRLPFLTDSPHIELSTMKEHGDLFLMPSGVISPDAAGGLSHLVERTAEKVKA